MNTIKKWLLFLFIIVFSLVVCRVATADRYTGPWNSAAAGAAVWGGITGTLSNQADLQAAFDARCLENVFGTAIGTGLTLDSTTLKTHASLQSIAGLTETNGGIPYGTADNTYAWLAAGAQGTLLMGNAVGAPSWLAAGTSGYVLLGAGAADPVWTATHAGTDITADLEEESHASEHTIGGGDVIDRLFEGADPVALTIGDATPEVASKGLYDCVGGTTITITDFVDSDGDHSEFSDGDYIGVLMNDSDVTIDLSSNSNIEGNVETDYTGHATILNLLIFTFIEETSDDVSVDYWQCINYNMGFSNPTTFSANVRIDSGTNPTTDYKGEISIDESDGGQDPVFLEVYDEGVGDASRIVGSDIICESYTIIEPDNAQAAGDDVKLKHFVAEAYPHGATIIAIHVVTDGTNISDTFLFERWDDADGTNQVTVESIGLSATDTGEDNGIDAGAITADFFLNLNLDDASDDYEHVICTVCYRINPGD